MAYTAQQIVDIIDAAIVSGATIPSSITAPDGRSLANRPLTELKEIRDYYARQTISADSTKLFTLRGFTMR